METADIKNANRILELLLELAETYNDQLKLLNGVNEKKAAKEKYYEALGWASIAKDDLENAQQSLKSREGK